MMRTSLAHQKYNSNAVIVQTSPAILRLEGATELTASSIRRTILVIEMLVVVALCFIWLFRHQLALAARRWSVTIPMFLFMCLWSIIQLPWILIKLLWAVFTSPWTLMSMLWRTKQVAIPVAPSPTTVMTQSASIRAQSHPFVNEQPIREREACSRTHNWPCNHDALVDRACQRGFSAGKQIEAKIGFRREHYTRQHCNCATGDLDCMIH